MNARELEKELLRHLEEIDMYAHALDVMAYDAHTVIPRKAYSEYVKVSTFFNAKVYQMRKDPRFIEVVGELHKQLDKLAPPLKALVRDLQKDIDDNRAIPNEEMEAYQRLCAESYEVWQKAKKTNNFQLWAPYLKQIVDTVKRFVSYRSTQFSTPYNALLNDFEPGIDETQLDVFFAGLKEHIVPLLKRISEKNKEMPLKCLTLPVLIARQKKLNRFLLRTLTFDTASGMISQSAHPFTMSICKHDVRLTTRFDINNFTYNMYSTIHEAGHGIYDQNQPTILHKYHITGTSYGVHEMHSRFYENHVGKSRAFIELAAPKMRSALGRSFKKISNEDFYLAINNIEASLIRTEADELTYSLHILIRYEIEKELINGNIDVNDLPKLWNQKYKEYLGVDVPSDSLGVLQDVHWSDGSFGYFPSYALGNAYAAQIHAKMKKEIDFDGIIASNQLGQIKKWLSANTFPYGRMITPNEWIIKVTGEPLNYKYYVEYLKEKFSDIYDLE